MVEPRKRHFPAEAKMVYEWTIKNHPFALQWRRVRLGPLPPKKQPQYYTQLRRFVDLIFYESGVVHLVEAKVRPDPGGISQLELYGEIFPNTPEFSMYKDQPVKLIYLTTIHDKVVESMCAKRNIQYIIFCPDWMKEYLNKRIFKL